MGINPVSHPVCLPDVDQRKVVILARVTNEDIDAGADKFGALLDLWPLPSRKNDADASPVHAVDQANPLWVSVGHKSEG